MEQQYQQSQLKSQKMQQAKYGSFPQVKKISLQNHHLGECVKFAVIREQSLPFLKRSQHQNSFQINLRSFKYHKKLPMSSSKSVSQFEIGQNKQNSFNEKQNRTAIHKKLIRLQHFKSSTECINQRILPEISFESFKNIEKRNQNSKDIVQNEQNEAKFQELRQLKLMKIKNKYNVERMRRKNQEHNLKLSSIIQCATKELLQKQNQMLQTMI